VLVSVKDANGKYKENAAQTIMFFPRSDVKVEHRRKIYSAPWGKEVRLTLTAKAKSVSALPMGGKFDLLLAKESL